MVSVIGNAQNSNENVLYIVDSIPIIEEPKEGFGTLSEKEIDRVEVLKNKEAIASTEFKNVDGIIYVFTKAYSKRSDSIKAIPSTKLMTKKNGSWYLDKSQEPYTGAFIDYYLNGKIQGQGYLEKGKLKGSRLLYHLNGEVSDKINYRNGISNGQEQRFYEDGTLMQEGNFKNGNESGVWKMFHPNGQLKQTSTFINGKMDGESISYYSTGEIKGKNAYENGVYQKDKVNDKLFELYNESQELYRKVDYKGAIKKLNKALELKSNWADGYIARGTMRLNDFQFEEAIKDFNKTLKIEPYFTNAYANRAFAYMRKYELGDSRELSEVNGIKVMATKEVEIPDNDLEKICSDLHKAIELGDNNSMVIEAIEKYCQE
jgi:antitoxin component YwqK of YwqJK toxin-antitoxin module